MNRSAPSRSPDIRVGVLVAESSGGYGGTARYMSGLVRALDPTRYRLFVVAAEGSPLLDRARECAKVKIRPSWRFPWFESDGRSRIASTVLTWLQLSIMVPVIYFWLWRHRIRLVHLNNDVSSHIPLLLASRLANCKIVSHHHGIYDLTASERRLVSYLDAIVTPSSVGAAFLDMMLKRSVAQTINNFVTEVPSRGELDEHRAGLRESLKILDTDKVVAIVGSLMPLKGHEVFLRALAAANKRTGNIIGVIVGQDYSPDKERTRVLVELCNDLSLSARVRFLGWQDNVWAVYAAADVVVSASICPEAFGLALVEAMAVRRAVIATNHGGPLEFIIPEVTGILVPPGDHLALGDAIARLTEDAALAAKLGEAGSRLVIERYSLSRHVVQMQSLYDGLLNIQRDAMA